MEISTNAIYRAQELLFLYKHQNQGKLPLIELKNLLPDQEPNRNSRHVVICMSGFLSENSDKYAEWELLADYVRDTKAALFALSWPSTKPKNLAERAGMKAMGLQKLQDVNYFELLRKARLVAQHLVKFGPVDLAVAGLGLVEVLADVFKYAKKNAKMTGKLLAYTLAMLFPFPTQSVSLVGFSLGNQVIKSCLKELHSLNANHIIHHVTFLAAAIDRMDRQKT